MPRWVWSAPVLALSSIVLLAASQPPPQPQCGAVGASTLNVSSRGTLAIAQIEGLWIAASGPPAEAATEAAIVMAESGGQPDTVQKGQPYATTGWGLWQITPGNSEPQFGVDQAILDPFKNAEAAVAKYKSGGLSQWTTYTSGAYLQYMSATVNVTPTSYTPTASVPVSYTPTSSTGYVNPFSQAQGLVPERVDMGVDYNAQAGSPILAIGDGRVIGAASGGTGWRSPENTQAAVYYQLTSGAEAGKFVYVAEDIIPTVKTGDAITAGQQIAMFKASSTGLETGWGTGTPYGALATTTGGYTEGQVTAAGVSFSAFLQSLGAPPGTMSATPVGALPAGYPTLAAPSGSSTSGCASASGSAVSPVIGHPTHCDFYLSPTGSDSNSGATPTEAWRTVDHLTAALPAGRIACLESGDYRAGTLHSDGIYTEFTQPNITITAAPGAAATIHGWVILSYQSTGSALTYLNLDLDQPFIPRGESWCSDTTYTGEGLEVNGNNDIVAHDDIYQTNVPVADRGIAIGVGYNPNPTTYVSTGITVAFNRVHDFGNSCHHGHGVYESASNSAIFDNWFWGDPAGGAGVQIYAGHPAPYIQPHDDRVYANVMDNVAEGFNIFAEGANYSGDVIQHNVIHTTTRYGGFAANSGAGPSIQFVSNDGTAIADGWPCGPSGGCGSVSTGGNVSVDPQYTNPAAGDFTVRNPALAGWGLPTAAQVG